MIAFIDNFSRQTCVYFLKETSEMFKKLKEFHTKNENLERRYVVFYQIMGEMSLRNT